MLNCNLNWLIFIHHFCVLSANISLNKRVLHIIFGWPFDEGNTVRLMLLMGVKFGLPGWWTNRGWNYSRLGFWGSYFDVTRRKHQYAVKLLFMVLAPDKKLFLFIKWGMMRGGKREAYRRRREIHKIFWLKNLNEGAHLEDLGADKE